jgi:hypothetical protein
LTIGCAEDVFQWRHGDAYWDDEEKTSDAPKGTQREIALGTLTAGSDTSSAMEEIVPIAEKVYAGGSKPMKNVKASLA